MWPTWRQDVAALLACLALGWLGLRGQRVPILAGADLGFHELGHLVGYLVDAMLPWPEVLTAAAGSVFQVAVPTGLAAYFLVARHDRVGGSVCLAWAATSAADVARYVADAPFEALPLIGGKHDWDHPRSRAPRPPARRRCLGSGDRPAGVDAVRPRPGRVPERGGVALLGPRHVSVTKI